MCLVSVMTCYDMQINPEKNFLMNFKSLVEWSVETLSLWQVLNEYNIEDVILHLDTVRHSVFDYFCY